jgi:hypothetical protein
MAEIASRKEKPRLAGGNEPGRGLQLRGALGNLISRVCAHRLLRREYANPLQFFVRKKPLFLVSRALHVANACFARDAGKFFGRQTEQVSRSRSGYILWYLIIHGASLMPA